MTLTPDDLDLPTLVALAGGVVSTAVLDQLGEAGYADVRASHGYILQLLIDGAPTIGAMAAALGITQQAVSKSVRELERRDYVRRVADASDARLRRVELTARGRELISAGRDARRRTEASIVALVTPDDVVAARRVLTAMLHAGGADAALAERRMPMPD